MRKHLVRFVVLVVVLAGVVVVPSARSAVANNHGILNTPDPSILRVGTTYYAYTTNSQNLPNCATGTNTRIKVPVRLGSLTSFGQCFRDAITSESPWYNSNLDNYWAPSVARNPDSQQYVLAFTQKQTSTGKYCIGLATSTQPDGPFDPRSSPLRCPSTSNYAIDPDVFVYNGQMYMSWRQDPSSTGYYLYVASLNVGTTGPGSLSSERLLFASSQIGWQHGQAIENPTIHIFGGRKWLMYSGDWWDGPNYAVGLADCGPYLLSGGQCTVAGGVTQPTIGFSTRADFPPASTTPEDRPGPGGLSIIRKASGGDVLGTDGSPYVALHWWYLGARFMDTHWLRWTPWGPVLFNY
jgi:hypothetical protein